MKGAWRHFWTITCSSFTSAVLCSILFSSCGLMAPLNNSLVLELLCMCVSTALGMAAADKILDVANVETLLPEVLLRFGICYVLIFSEGALFQMFPFDFRHMAEVLPVLVPTYAVTHFAAYRMSVACASEINHKIEQETKSQKS
ncbi:MULTISPECIES: hypothetical protein [Caproicibacterium]|uniref:Uncharacterized protein n=1 Tax=Caproicibacterium argilliputei TaxID=3030016 RepID=A0AA97D8T4_9FIRM|nr:hypothetical protein [Caproicibacterium argilliputei]WOC31394.1 hypothetical protein PXC00_09200 [Caproicibacterium argilliputei]